MLIELIVSVRPGALDLILIVATNYRSLWPYRISDSHHSYINSSYSSKELE